MKYLVLGVWHDGESNQVATHSKEIELGFDKPEDQPEKIISNLCYTGLDRDSLWEVFVFMSAQNYGDAPVQVAYWTTDDGFFGDPEDEEEEEEDDQG